MKSKFLSGKIGKIIKEQRPEVVWGLFFVILTVGLYLRFVNISSYLPFGWDQARDSWTVRDLLMGKLVLAGPKTGVGDFHLGPLYFYLLAPFFAISNLDPGILNGVTFLVNIVNFVFIFWVMKKIFGSWWALLSISIYSFGEYFVNLNKTSWNVSFLPAISFVMFFCFYKILEGKSRYFPLLFLLWGLFFQVHFTAVIFLLAIPGLIVFLKNRGGALKWMLISSPILILFLLPNIVYDFSQGHGDFFRYVYFLDYYVVRPRWPLFTSRLSDVLLDFSPVIYFWKFIPGLNAFKFILPAMFFVLVLIDKTKQSKILAICCLLFFAAVASVFTVYGGPTSDYYFLVTLPAVFAIVIYLQRFLLLRFKPFILLFLVFWGAFFYNNILDDIGPKGTKGLDDQKREAKGAVAVNQRIKFNEGDIKSYLYVVWADDKKKFK